MDAYANDKLIGHPDLFENYRQTGRGKLITVHLMPQNLCNQSCAFCCHRMVGNERSEAFDEGAHIGKEDLENLLLDFNAMGVQGVEVTGGGEPLAYPHTKSLWGMLREGEFATALVTNGTLMKDWAPLICSTRLKWARVSIDAATNETYQKIRKCPPDHFDKSWRAVRELREHAPADPEFRLGLGFVACRENLGEVWEFVDRAKDEGVDNVRIAPTFSWQGADYFAGLEAEFDDALDQASEAAERFHEPGVFEVANLMPERAVGMTRTTQDYPRCPTIQFYCVVEGEGKVYTCCTFTGSEKGCLGRFQGHPGGFRGLWKDSADRRENLVPSVYCTTSCLHHDRNLSILRAIEPKLHQEFL